MKNMTRKIDAKQRHTDTKQHLTLVGVTCYPDRVLGWWCNVRRFSLRAGVWINPGLALDRLVTDSFLFLGEKTPQKVRGSTGAAKRNNWCAKCQDQQR
jgi:hypothetical protein